MNKKKEKENDRGGEDGKPKMNLGDRNVRGEEELGSLGIQT